MPGTLLKDALVDGTYGKLEQGVTLNAAGTTSTGSIAAGSYGDVRNPLEVQVELATSTVSSTGNSATLEVEIQSSDDPTFATGVVSHGKFAKLSGSDASQSNLKRYLLAYSVKRYMRATATVAGTAPSYAGTTIRVREENFNRNRTTTA